MNPVVFHHDFRELRQKAPNAAVYILMCSNLSCTNNYKIPTTLWSINEEKKWILNLKCSVCHLSWCVCWSCDKVKVRLVTSRQILNHYNANHNDACVARKRKRKIFLENDSVAKEKDNTVTVIENETTTKAIINSKEDVEEHK
jgi:hypothetical protein